VYGFASITSQPCQYNRLLTLELLVRV
jgi:hypothetical protein